MSKRTNKSRQPKRTTSSLQDHLRQGKVLSPPLAQLPVTPTRWNRDALPEFMWIDAVASSCDWPRAVALIHETLDVLDEYYPTDARDIVDGTLSSFAIIPDGVRGDVLSRLQHDRLYEQAFPETFLHALALYSECPVDWILAPWRPNTHADHERGIGHMKGAIRRLFDGHGVYATRCRMFPVARMFKHGKIKIAVEQSSFELFPKYPDGLTADEQSLVEATTRATFNAIYNTDEIGPWVPYFWRHNFDISACELPSLPHIEYANSDSIREARVNLRDVINDLRRTLENEMPKAKLDLYEPDRDEVLFGLIARQFRLFSIMALDPQLWTPEVGNMLCRIIADTYLLTAWLIKRNDLSLFKRYKAYSVGKQKLFKLHLEEALPADNKDAERAIESLSESINEELWEELVTIDVGAPFEGMDSRKMAHETGLERVHRLVYSPYSADVHGEWTNLKVFHLQRCTNPLHRFHRLPRLTAPAMLVPQIVLDAAAMLAGTLRAWTAYYELRDAGARIDEFEDKIAGAFDIERRDDTPDQ